MSNFLDPKKPTTRALLVGVQTPDMKPGEGAELLSELIELVENIGLAITHSTLINLRDRQQPKFLIGTGKAAELIAQAKAEGADVIVIDEELSPAHNSATGRPSPASPSLTGRRSSSKSSPTAPKPARPCCRSPWPAWNIHCPA
jgi:hypothetical protein